jgi:hypothetical protein
MTGRIHAFIQRIKHILGGYPKLYACVGFFYRVVKYVIKRDVSHHQRPANLRRRIAERMARYPHLFLYAKQLDIILHGKWRLGLSGMLRQVVLDIQRIRHEAENKLYAESIRKLTHQALICCIKHDVAAWWEFLSDAEGTSVKDLQGLLREGVLRRAGDYKEYLRLRQALCELSPTALAENECYDQLARHYARTLDEIESGALTRSWELGGDQRPFLIGFSVWGERYMHLLLNYCLPSLLAEGNLPALCAERQPIFFIHTNAECKQTLEQSEMLQRLKSLGVMVHYRMLDPSLIALFKNNPNFCYWHLGLVQSLDLFVAKATGADFHLLLPDQIYSAHHFAGLLRVANQGHHAITRLGLSTRLEGICPAVEAYRREGAISIPAADLASLSVAHIHSASWSWIATNKNLANELPNACMIAWEGPDQLHLLSPHQTILYLDRELLGKLAPRFFITLDSELAKIIPESCELYCPRKEDGLYLVEVTPESVRPAKQVRFSIAEFCRTFWFSANGSMSYWRFFDEGIIDALNRDMLQDRPYMKEADISHLKRTLKNILLQNIPVMPAQKAWLAGQILQRLVTHPGAVHLKSRMEGMLHDFGSQLEMQNYSGSGQVLKLEHKKVLQKLYHDAILCCIRHGAQRWWNFLPNTSFDSIPVLQNFLRECVLRRAGDYQEFLRIRGELKKISSTRIQEENFFDTLCCHFAHALEDIDSGSITCMLDLSSGKRPFLIGFSVWGESYIRMLLDYCLPSLLADGNFKALVETHQPVLFIHTKPEDRTILEQADVMRRVKSLGVQVVYMIVNHSLVQHFCEDPNYVYWHLGMVQSIDLYVAKALGADYHLLMPDSVYSKDHFKNLLQAAGRGNPVIIRLMLSTNMEGICPEIDRYREGSAIAIPAADLTALSVAHVHSASRSWIITGNNLQTEMPKVHVAILEGKETLHMLSPHQTIVYLDHALVKGLRKRFYLSLDSELDKIIPLECAVYCPQAADEICLIEMTSQKQRPSKLSWGSSEEFSRTFWSNTQESMSYWKVFDASIIDRLNRELVSERAYMKETEIMNAKRTIKEALLAAYPQVSVKQLGFATNVLHSMSANAVEQEKTLILSAIAELQQMGEAPKDRAA